MAQHERHPADQADLDRDDRERPDEPRGVDDEEEFDEGGIDDEDLDEEEGDVGDEDIRAGDAVGTDRRFTHEIGSEGGSRGDVEIASDRPSPLTGSEAGTTGRPAGDNQPSFPDRQKGPGY